MQYRYFYMKGLSVTDADFLIRIAEVLDTKVSILLGGTITDETDKNAIAEQLAKISEQLAIKNKRSKIIWKTVAIILLLIVIFNIILVVVNVIPANHMTENTNTTVSESYEEE